MAAPKLTPFSNKTLIKGIVAPPNNNNGKGKSFFEKAFGKNISEYKELLYMPEPYIIYRKVCEKELGYTERWKKLFNSLKISEEGKIKQIIENNDFKKSFVDIKNKKSIELLKHYSLSRNDIKRKISK